MPLGFKVDELLINPLLTCGVLKRQQLNAFHNMRATCRGIDQFAEEYKNSIKQNALRDKFLNIENSTRWRFGETTVKFLSEEEMRSRVEKREIMPHRPHYDYVKSDRFPGEWKFVEIQSPRRLPKKIQILPLKDFIEVMTRAIPTGIYTKSNHARHLEMIKKLKITTDVLKIRFAEEAPKGFLEHLKPKTLTIYYHERHENRVSTFLQNPILDTVESLNIKCDSKREIQSSGLDLSKILKHVNELFLGNQKAIGLPAIRAALKDWYDGKNNLKKLTIKMNSYSGERKQLEDFFSHIPNTIVTRVLESNPEHELLVSQRSDGQTATLCKMGEFTFSFSVQQTF